MIGRLENMSPRSALEGRETAIAGVLTALWVLLLLAYGAGYFGFFGDLATPRDAAFLEVVFFLMVLVLPLALIWLGAAMLRRSFQIQDEARRLEKQVRTLQSGARGQSTISQPRLKDNRVETLQSRVSELAKQIKQMETTVTSIGQMQAAMQANSTPPPTEKPVVKQFHPAAPPDRVPSTPSAPETGTHLDIATLVKALDFPRDENDTMGFRALRVAKQNTDIEELLRASEDILNLMSQEGIYMDDLRPDDSVPREWRLFAGGARGGDVASVGAIDAPEALERISKSEKTDQIFRDATLYFLRRFDIMLKQFVENANDAEIRQLADSRTGRAFMLLARASGMFD